MKTLFNPKANHWNVDVSQPVFVKQEGLVLNILFDFKNVPARTSGEEGITDMPAMTEAEHVKLNQPVTRDRVVEAIIAERYDDSKEKAIINNHLMDATAEHEKEYEAYKQWRIKAKSIADSVMKAL